MCLIDASLIPRSQEQWLANLSEFKLYMDVTLWQLQYFIQAVSIELVHMILMIFPAATANFLAVEVTV